MTGTAVMPGVEEIASRAREILAAWQDDPEFERLRTGCAKYDSDWQSFTGYAIVDGFDAVGDAPGLFPEATRAMALKAAVYEMTGDEQLAELPVSVPVDEMVHALAAQFTVLCRMQDRLGVLWVHATDCEDIGAWEPGDVTDRAYRAAWGDAPNPRYWLSRQETVRRQAVVTAKYEPLGILDGGRRFLPGFALGAVPA